MNKKQTRHGFTLIELLVIVLIIGILAAVALPQYQMAVAKSRSVEALTNLRALEHAQQAYFLANGQYTTVLEDLDITLKANSSFYRYQCFASGLNLCMAYSKVAKYPDFEFKLKLKKHWCTLNNKKNTSDKENARKICKLLGTVDPDMSSDYYLLQHF